MFIELKFGNSTNIVFLDDIARIAPNGTKKTNIKDKRGDWICVDETYVEVKAKIKSAEESMKTPIIINQAPYSPSVYNHLNNLPRDYTFCVDGYVIASPDSRFVATVADGAGRNQ